MQEGMGFCFIFWLLSIKDEGSLGILNQKIHGAVTLFWVQITRNEKTHESALLGFKTQIFVILKSQFR
jgi:hypothetical protein